jgi:hypothetical protein
MSVSLITGVRTASAACRLTYHFLNTASDERGIPLAFILSPFSGGQGLTRQNLYLQYVLLFVFAFVMLKGERNRHTEPN